ncbi:hypothetical protein PROFUN_02109 [Planoprotostelium fungivorum]|uniref:Uncharacterized protein n=1 Tax=Planoprotostelium fungivorum TaxID=1890364 RepID=A0A2P6NZ46_9EUKA|nr:hypothetical protein PROFUN_02109 [Planoprotostelium fungivorum]
MPHGFPGITLEVVQKFRGKEEETMVAIRVALETYVLCRFSLSGSVSLWNVSRCIDRGTMVKFINDWDV